MCSTLVILGLDKIHINVRFHTFWNVLFQIKFESQIDVAFGSCLSSLHSLMLVTELPEFCLLLVLFLLRDSKTTNGI